MRHGAVAILLLAILSACGPLGDDDDDDEPTAAGSAPTSEVGASTPVATSVATPRAQPGPGTPRAGIAPSPTPEPDDAASGDEDGNPEADDEPTEAVAGETAEADENAAEPTEEDEPDPTTVVVADCEEPEELPERTGRQNRVVAEDALRLRAGPGITCDEITSLALETPVRVLSGIVESEDDGIEWVKVDVDGTEGWVAVEFLENPPAD